MNLSIFATLFAKTSAMFKKRARAEVKVNVSHFEAKNKLSTL